MIKNIDNYQDLDNLVFCSNSGTVFQTSFWLDNSTSSFVKLGYYENDVLLACLIFETQPTKNIGKLGSLAPYLGLVTRRNLSENVKDKVETDLIHFAKNNFSNVTFFTSPKYNNLKNLLFNGFDAKLSYTNILCLDKSLEIIFNDFAHNLKRNIKKAKLDDLRVVREFELANLTELVKTTFLRQNSSIWFNMLEVEKCISQLLKNNYSAIFTTFQENEPIASVCIVWDNNTVYYILGGFNHHKKHRGAVSIAMWEAIQFSKSINLLYYDFEGSRVPNINNFFSQFGGNQFAFYQILDFKDTITIY